jgi:hypothetical protein
VDLGGAAGEHFVDVALVGNVEYKFVAGCGEHPVQGHAQLDDAEVGAEVAAGFRQRIDQRVADLGRELRQIFVSEIFDIAG